MSKNKKSLKLLKKIVSIGVEKNPYGWPPCMGILHQPKRPETRKKI